jgi:hypothetical protein
MQNSMYYTTSGLTSLPTYQGGGYLDQYGRQQYGLGKLVKKITKPIAKVLDKVVPNEIKPALPFVAAAVPFMFPAFTAGLGSLGGLIQNQFAQGALGSAILKAGSDLSQEGAAQRGLNPVTLGLSALSGGFAQPGGTASLGLDALKASQASTGMLSSATNLPLSNVSQLPVGALTETSGLGGLFPQATASSLTVPAELSLLEQAKNAALTGVEKIGKFIEVPEGGVSILDNPLEAAKKLAVPVGSAASEQAYIAAQKALDEYNAKMGTIKSMTQADLADRRNAVIRYMQLAGFGQTDIDSALSRSGLKDGGQPTKQQPMPINPEMLALAIFGKRFDELTYTQKETLSDYIDLPKKAKGGIMDLGGKEMDLRASGGFVPIGKKERADDVPARLSKNEFVMTAKAVRNAGNGDIRKGAKKMYKLMRQLEAK